MKPATNDLSIAFLGAFRMHPAGVAIVSAMTDNGPQALTVSSLISLSAAPPCVAFSISRQSVRSEAILSAKTVVIHFPGPKSRKLVETCSTAGTERFDGTYPWQTLPSGEPRFTEIETWFRARMDKRISLAQATLVAATVLEAYAPDEDLENAHEALVYVNRGFHRLCAASSRTHDRQTARQPLPTLLHKSSADRPPLSPDRLIPRPR